MEALDISSWIGVGVGYTFSLIFGALAISWLVDTSWIRLGLTKREDEAYRPHVWQPVVIGIVERTLFTGSLQMGHEEFIGIWLALKVAGQWKIWAEKEVQVGERKVRGHNIYQVFVLGTGFSVLYAAVGYLLIGWINEKHFVTAVGTASALILLTVGLRFAIKKL